MSEGLQPAEIPRPRALGRDAHVLLTGAGRGIGAELATELARRGHRLSLVARSRNEIGAVAATIGEGAHAIAADVSDPDAVEAMATAAMAAFGPIDALVNNAAILGPVAPVEGTEGAGWMEVQRVNVFGAYLCLRAVLPRIRDGGLVLGVSSGAAQNTLRNHSAYNTSKAGFEQLHRVTQAEVAGRDITIALLDPGGVDTRLMGEVLASDFPDAPLFRTMAAAGGLRPPVRVAARIADLLEAGLEPARRYRMDDLDPGFRNGAP